MDSTGDNPMERAGRMTFQFTVLATLKRLLKKFRSRSNYAHLAVALGVVALLSIIFSLSAVFASERSAAHLASIGSRGVFTEGTLSAAATTRNRAMQAVLIDAAESTGLSDSAEVEEALTATLDGLNEFEVRLQLLGPYLAAAGAELMELAGAFSESVNELVAVLESDQPLLLEEAVLDMDDSYLVLAGSIARDRDVLVAELSLAQREAGRIADAARFLVAFAVPLAAVFVFRRSLRRRQRQEILVHELTRQREVARAKDDFIADLSHELRTPLTGINGFAATLLDPKVGSDPEMVNEFSTIIAREADELSRMVDDLLAVARANENALSFRLEEVDPQVEVDKVLAPLGAQGIEVHARVASGSVTADRGRLRQVLRNLVSNAIKHGRAPIAIKGLVRDGRYHLEVIDNGPGVPSELEERLFARYIHQGRDALLAGSVGLGLSISLLLTRRMGGDLTYVGGDVTRFIIDLGLWEEDVPINEPANEPTSLAEAGAVPSFD
ncbi:MAG: sensor histidine kinase [Acidimicrobiia bacterium]